jgi:hypothetical protein
VHGLFDREIVVTMKRLIVQVCAIAICTGMYPLVLPGLSFHQDAGPGAGVPHFSAPALHQGAAPEDVLRTDVPAIPGPQEDRWLRELATMNLFATVWPGSQDMACSIDPGTLCITLDKDGTSRVFPVVSDSRGSLLEEVWSRDMVPAGSLSVTMVLAGLGLMALSGLWGRKRSASRKEKVPAVHPAAGPPVRTVIEEKSASRSIAA